MLLLCGYRLIGLLTLTQLIHTFVLLTANIDDVKKLVGKFVSAPMAEQIADFLARASNYRNVAISKENEQNAEDVIQLYESESDQEHFDRAAREGSSKIYSLETRTTPNFQAQEDTVSIERTTENVKTKATKNLIDQWQHIKIPQHKAIQHKAIKQTWQREESANIPRAELPPVKPQRLEEKHQKQPEMEKKEVVHPRQKEKWLKDEKIWQEMHEQDNQLRERLQEPTEPRIPKPNNKIYELKEASKVQEKILTEKHQKLSNAGKKGKKKYWPRFITKTTHAPKPDRHNFEDNQREENNNNNPNNYEEQTPETELKFDEGNQDYEMTPPSTAGYEERIMEQKAKTQRKRVKNRERFALMNNVQTTPPSTVIDLPTRFNGFNIEHSKVTSKKERNEFDQYDNLKSMQYYPRSQLAATSGNVLLPKLDEDRREAKMPAEPLTLPKVEPQSWWDQEKEKAGGNIEDKNIIS